MSVQVTRFIVQIILARLLAPEVFGVVAVALVTLQFLDKITDIGTGSAIIQRKELTERLVASVFVLNLGLSACLFAAMVLLSPSVARLFGTPEASPVLQVMSAAVLLTGFGNVQQALLRRRLRFRSVASITTGSALANAVVAIPAAALGAGVWALVGGHLALALTASLGAHFASGWRPRFAFDKVGLLSLRSYSLNLTLFNLVNFALRNSDKLIVGRFLGARALGIYTIADRILQYPLTTLQNSLSQVLFPALSRTQSDVPALQRAVLRACGSMAIITFPAMAGLAAVAEPFTLALLGEQWKDAIPLIMVLAPAGAWASISLITGMLFQALGRTRLLLALAVVMNGILVLVFLAAAQYGLFQVAAGFAGAALLLSAPVNAIALRLIGLGLSDLAEVLWSTTFASIVMAVVVAVTDRMVLSAAVGSSLLRLMLGVLLGVFVYGAMIFLLRPTGLADVYRVLGLHSRLPE